MSEVLYVDATLRDLAHLPWGSAVGTDELALAASALAGAGASTIEVLDARSARAAIISRSESPWDRLRAVGRELRDTPIGIVLGGRNLWGDQPAAPDVVRQLVLCATESGTARVRVTDPLNDPDAMAVLAEAVNEAGAALVPTLIVGPAPAAGDPLWTEEARALAELPGAAAICVSDGAGHLPPSALAALVRAVAAVTDLPIEVQVQAPGGMAPLLAIAAVDAGAAAVQASAGPVALVSARPSAETVRAALLGGPRMLSCNRAGLDRAARVVGPVLPADRLRQAAGAVFGPAVAVPPALEVGLVARLGRMGLSRNLVSVAEEASAVASAVGAATLGYPLGGAILAQAARHVIEGRHWSPLEQELARVALGQRGRLRGPVAPEVLAAARAEAPEAPTPPQGLSELAGQAPEGASEEDLVLWALYGEEAERVIVRRRSLGAEADSGGDAPAIVDRGLLETLIGAVETADDAEVTVEVSGTRITVRRAAPGAAPEPAGAEAPAHDVAAGLVRIESPMVGTFYKSPAPDAGPFVEVGQRVEAGQTLCLLEAMKLFNEIQADVEGVVREVCVENGEAVEYGQLLFVIQP